MQFVLSAILTGTCHIGCWRLGELLWPGCNVLCLLIAPDQWQKKPKTKRTNVSARGPFSHFALLVAKDEMDAQETKTKTKGLHNILHSTLGISNPTRVEPANPQKTGTTILLYSSSSDSSNSCVYCSCFRAASLRLNPFTLTSVA